MKITKIAKITLSGLFLGPFFYETFEFPRHAPCLSIHTRPDHESQLAKCINIKQFPQLQYNKLCSAVPSKGICMYIWRKERLKRRRRRCPVSGVSVGVGVGVYRK